MEVGSLFHSFVAATVKVRSPALLRVLGQERRKGSVLDRRFILKKRNIQLETTVVLLLMYFWCLVMKCFKYQQQYLKYITLSLLKNKLKASEETLTVTGLRDHDDVPP